MKSSENYSVWLTRNGATRTEVITQDRSQNFLRGKCDPTRRWTEQGWGRGVRLSETAFRARALYFTVFENGNAGCHYLKRKKSRKKAVDPYYSLGLMHELGIMIFQ